MSIFVRDLQNDMIKPSENGGLEIWVDSVTQKVLISHTTLSSCIQPHLGQMNPKLRQICGCEISIIPKIYEDWFKYSEQEL